MAASIRGGLDPKTAFENHLRKATWQPAYADGPDLVRMVAARTSASGWYGTARGLARLAEAAQLAHAVVTREDRQGADAWRYPVSAAPVAGA